MKIIIFEDEQPSGEKLIKHIKKNVANPSIQWLRSIKEGIQLFSIAPQVDLIFSDIELLDGNIFELYNKFTPPCPIIFCTAYDNYLIHAFETNGIAYLLKPYDQKDFDQAWNKFKDLYYHKIESDLFSQLSQLLNTPRKEFKKTLLKKTGSETFLLDIEQIILFRAHGDYSFAFDNHGTRHLIDYAIGTLEKQLDPHLFYRINRSEIVAFKAILKYDKYVKNRLVITLRNQKNVLYTSNSRSNAFKDWIDAH